VDLFELIARSEWPVVVGGALFLFRRPIRELFGRINLTKIDAWGLKAEFEKGLDKVEELTPDPKTIVTDEPFRLELKKWTEHKGDYITALLPFLENMTPEAVVLDSWSRLEGEMRTMTDELHPRGGLPTPPLRIEGAAEELGLTKEEIESLMVLRRLRNKVAHSASRSLTWDDAERFKRASDLLLLKMKLKVAVLKRK
jgi:hypothetical protein